MPSGYGAGLYGEGLYGHQLRPIPGGSLLDRVIGPEAVWVTLGGAVVPSTAVGTITLRHGRANVDSQPDAATATVTMRSTALGALPVMGDGLAVELGADAASWLGLAGAAFDAARWRFVGKVTDVLAAPDSVVTGPATVTVVAVGSKAPLGRIVVGDTPWPVESDGARAARILALAGITPAYVDDGLVDVDDRDVDAQPALGLLDELARDSGAVLVELRDGTLAWQDAGHRAATVPTFTLPASAVLAPTATRMDLAGVVNDLTVTCPAGSVRVVDQGSVDRWGRLAAQLDTKLAGVDDAGVIARLIVGRRATPRWAVPALTVDLARTVDPPLAGQLLSADVSTLLAVDGFPASGPFATADLWLEGWSETITRRSWLLQLDVSDYRATATPLTWAGVPAGLAWADVDPTTRWLDARSVDALTP